MNKTRLLMMGLLLAGASLFAEKYNLYGGKPQSFTLRNLTPGQDYRWELRTSNDRPMSNGQIKANDDGSAEIELDVPRLEPGVMVKCKLKIPPEKEYQVVFHSRELFAPIMASLQQFGVYTENSELKNSLKAAGIPLAESDQARIILVSDVATKKLSDLLTAGKTVICFADGNNEITPPREKIRKITMEPNDSAKKMPSLSVLYNKSKLKIANDGNSGIIDIYYAAGHLIVVAPQLRRELDIKPELWLILKHKITEDLEKWSKEQSSER